jgi:hypothetical protein
LKIFEEKTNLKKIRWDGSGYTMNMKMGGGGVADISTVDAYSRIDLCTPIFLDKASKQDFTKE